MTNDPPHRLYDYLWTGIAPVPISRGGLSLGMGYLSVAYKTQIALRNEKMWSMLNSVNKKAGSVQRLPRPAIEVFSALGSFPANYSRNPTQVNPRTPRNAGLVPDACRTGLKLDALKLTQGYPPPSTRVSPDTKQFGLSTFHGGGNIRELITPGGLCQDGQDADYPPKGSRDGLVKGKGGSMSIKQGEGC